MSDLKVVRNWLDRDHNWANGPIGVHRYPCDACEALAVLDRMEAERDRLREALEQVEAEAEPLRSDPRTNVYKAAGRILGIARRALEGTNNE